MKKNGFTLTEMIAVIVIIGVVLLITIPVMDRMLQNNKQDKYMFYVETVEKALYSYGDLEYPMTVYEIPPNLKTITVSLNDLISKKYLKKFSEEGVSVSNATFSIKKEKGKIISASGGAIEVKLIFVEGTKNIECSKSGCSIL